MEDSYVPAFLRLVERPAPLRLTLQNEAPTKSRAPWHLRVRRRSGARSCCWRDRKHCGPAIGSRSRLKATGRSGSRGLET